MYQSKLTFLLLKRLLVSAIIIGFTDNINAQSQLYFQLLDKWSSEIPENILVDSILKMPYDVMVSDFAKSKDWLQKAKKTSLISNSRDKLAEVYQRLGIVHYLQGTYDSSTYYNLEAIGIYESLGNSIKAGTVLCTQGYQSKRRDLSEAFQFFRKGLKILEKSNATSELLAAYDNFGVLFEMRNDLDSAEIFYSKALQLKTTLNDSIGIPYSLNNLALIAILRQNFGPAKALLDQAYNIRLVRNDQFGLIENTSLYGDYYQAVKENKTAIEYYLQSNAMCDQLNYLRQKHYNLEQLLVCYESEGKFAAALKAAKESAVLQDLLQREQNNKTVIELEQRFKVAEKDKSIAELEKETAEKRLYILLIGVALLVVFFGALLIFQINKRHASNLKNAAILTEREAGLKAVFDATESERKRIAKDLHDGIGQQLSGLRLGWEGLEQNIRPLLPEQSAKLHALNTVLDEACIEVRSISHRMMPKALQEKGILAAIDDLLRKSIGITSINYRVEHFRIDNERFDERIELGLYRICQELIGNILKHSKATDIIVQLYKNTNQIIMIVEDNGVGFDPAIKKDGTGLKNIESRLQTIGGAVTWERGPERGTVASVKVIVASK